MEKCGASPQNLHRDLTCSETLSVFGVPTLHGEGKEEPHNISCLGTTAVAYPSPTKKTRKAVHFQTKDNLLEKDLLLNLPQKHKIC